MSQIEVDKVIPQSGTALQVGESGDTITIPSGATITNNGTATGFDTDTNDKVKVSANDTTAGFLNGKLVAGTNISLTEGTDGGNETLTAALSGTIATSQISNDAITLDKMAPGTDGNIISYDASGNPVAVATGSAGQVLTSAGAGAPPTFAAAPSGGLVKISTVTCSDTATVDFDNLSSDYNMYIIIGSQIRPATNDIDFQMNFGDDGSTYSKNKTSVYFVKYNNEADSDLGFGTHAGASLGNSTSDQQLMRNVRNHSNYGKAGQIKAYISGLGQGGNYASYDIYSNYWHTTNYSYATHVSGMVQANCDCIRFKANSGNIAVGKFTLYGVNQ